VGHLLAYLSLSWQTGLVPDTIPGMDGAAVLSQLDKERQTIPESDVSLQTAPYVVRAIALDGSWNGIVFSCFSSSQTEEIVSEEIKYFTQLNRVFEWKVYSHDRPLDLLLQLRRRGFKIGEEESLMVRELRDLPPALMAPAAPKVAVDPVRDEQGVADFLSIETAVWSCEPGRTRELLLSMLNNPTQRDLAFVAYADQRPVGCARLTSSPNSQFSGLWGGSVLPDYRRQGIYRALLAARILHLRGFEEIRYLRVDALPMSRPILEKYGFQRIASTWPAEWPPNQ
jgi:GNAT superfamily N-acetyltransferase